jgi:hypothetical protein
MYENYPDLMRVLNDDRVERLRRDRDGVRARRRVGASRPRRPRRPNPNR